MLLFCPKIRTRAHPGPLCPPAASPPPAPGPAKPRGTPGDGKGAEGGHPSGSPPTTPISAVPSPQPRELGRGPAPPRGAQRALPSAASEPGLAGGRQIRLCEARNDGGRHRARPSSPLTRDGGELLDQPPERGGGRGAPGRRHLAAAASQQHARRRPAPRMRGARPRPSSAGPPRGGAGGSCRGNAVRAASG